jgi:hypothetical protein
VLMLALGIGASTAIFSVIEGVLLRARNEITCAVYFAGLGWMV